MKHWKKGFELTALAVLVWAMLQSFGPAKIERTRVIKKDFDAKTGIKASHEHGPMIIKKSTDGRNHVEAEILVIGTDEASIEELLNKLDLKTKESNDYLELATSIGIANWQKVNDKATIKFCDGDKIKGIKDFKVTLTLHLADPQQLKLYNKYDQIVMKDDFNGDLSVALYSGEFLAGNLGGQFDLDLKYGKAKMGAVGKAKWMVYDAEVEAGPIQMANVSSKYSEYRLGPVSGDLNLTTYDENWQLGNVGGRLKMDDKYSEFKFGDIGKAQLMIFDAAFKAENVGQLDINDSKYTEFKLRNVGEMNLTNVFDDSYQVEEVNRLVIGDSKYTEYRIGRLGKYLQFGQSFDDEIRIEAVAADFDYIQLEGKYTELDMDLAEDAKFELSVEMQYGEVDYQSQQMEVRKHEEKNSRTSIVAYKGGQPSSENFNSIKISGFDNDVKLR